jgi:hypothetical protein
VLSLVLVVAIFYYLLTKIDLVQTWAAITDMTWLELATLGLLVHVRRSPVQAARTPPRRRRPRGLRTG